ncbi:MAG: hypothetical protein CBC16_08435 [Verrucomicrobia bacterium TMED56]|nr:MAG: hypothetical protein CBC16_08435 [Verrucomicrobia bacterium TMED56]
MKMYTMSGRFVFGGLLGLILAFVFAEFCSHGLFGIYSTSTIFRSITGSAPNELANIFHKISWALFFCSSWWMLWRFDLFFIPALENPDQETFQKEVSSNSKSIPEENIIESYEAEDQQEIPEKDSSQEKEDNSIPEKIFNEQDDYFLKILNLPDDSKKDFDAIKSVYRKKIAQYHPDKVSAMGPEIREVAEQKAKEINEAYEHFRKKFSS